MYKSIIVITTLLSTNLYAYTAYCNVGWNGDKPTQKFTIVVKDGVLTRYAEYGTYVSYFRYMENGQYVYSKDEIRDKVYSPHDILGEFNNGEFSYIGIAYGGDIISGTCFLDKSKKKDSR